MSQPTARMKSLTDLIGQDMDALFATYGDSPKGSAAAVVAERLIDSLNGFSYAEGDYERALASISRKTQEQVDGGVKGFTADAMWIVQAAGQAEKAAAEMAKAVEKIRGLVGVLKAL